MVYLLFNDKISLLKYCKFIIYLQNKYKITNIIVQKNQTIPDEKISKEDNPRSHNNKHNKISLEHNQIII